MNNNHGRRRARRASKKAQISRILLTICMMALVAMVSVGATLAWLTDNTPSVTNTFAASGIDITLVESPLKDDGTYGAQAENVSNEYKVIPGKEYKKDPTVKVLKTTDVPVYLFVKFEEVANPSAYYSYTSNLNTANDWNLVEGETNVWYREVQPDTENDQSWQLLDGDKISVKTDITTGNIADAAKAKLVYTAYAIQTQGPNNEKFTPAAAWAAVNPTPGT